ncbi:hypothetical protein [Ralstonia chuxiongensis]|uniref:Integron cassette protein VCH-CASS1 chain domain-containing protein n=1 Tax=Ralstonia chuxiongensis TaxID=2957504 RepID=A0AA41WZ91_9RALS|nr:hypothetical protein [Ralstonia chuxiongensis]MCP1175629.1 hypothetical protein [Ralstonia chuxiongensis]
MATSVTEVEVLRQYIEGVMQRADHHARGVDEVALPMIGAILWRKDADQEIRVLKNVLWVHIGGNRYAFSYNHDTGEIEMRDGSTQGNVKYAFDNSVSAAQVKTIFERL